MGDGQGIRVAQKPLGSFRPRSTTLTAALTQLVADQRELRGLITNAHEALMEGKAAFSAAAAATGQQQGQVQDRGRCSVQQLLDRMAMASVIEEMQIQALLCGRKHSVRQLYILKNKIQTVRIFQM